VPRFEPFQALRYGSNVELKEVCSPPYDVLSDADRLALANKHENNIVHIDMPLAPSGNAYEHAASVLTQWIGSSVMVRDEVPSFTLYRMQFTDSTGKPRNVVGVIGALEVVDEGAGGVLPHERTTPKAKTDRLELTRATDANLSPVWGLSLASGLSKLLSEPGEHLGSVIDDLGVIHSVERVADGARIAAISTAISSHPVVIADGHHRYAISRTYRDETRDRLNSKTSGAELTMTYVNELIDEQLSVAAIHRLYEGISYKELAAALSPFFTITDAYPVGPTTLSQMNERNSLDATAAILIRPVSVAEIQRTANEGLLMPPKSTFFTPKLRTGFVLREMKTR